VNKSLFHSKNTITKSILQTLVSQYLISGINLLFTIYWVRVLSKSEFAIIAASEILFALGTFTDPGLNTSFNKHAPKYFIDSPEKGRFLFKQSFFVRLVLLVIFVLACCIFSGNISKLILKNLNYYPYICLFAIATIPAGLTDNFIFLAKSLNDFKTVALINFVSNFSRQIIGLALWSFIGFKGYALAQPVALFVVLLLLIAKYRSFFYKTDKILSLRINLAYSFPFYLRQFFRYGFGQLDQLLVGLLLKPEYLAAFSVAKKVVSYLSSVVSTIFEPMLVKVASAFDGTKIQDKYLLSALVYFPIALLPIIILISGNSQIVMELFAGEKYKSMWPILSLLCIGQFGSFMCSNINMFVFVSKPPLYTLIVDGVIGAINYLGAPIAIIFMKIYGIAIAQIFAFFVGFVIGFLIIKAECAQIDFLSKYAKLGVSSIIMAAFLILSAIQKADLWLMILYNILGLVAYLCIVYYSIVNKRDKAIIAALVPKRFQNVYNKTTLFLSGSFLK
jgi:O-antigen/teichoic acid export membrane protein